MIRTVIQKIAPYVDALVFTYSVALVISCILMGALAFYAMIRYINRNRSTDYNPILFSGSLEPGISVIVPCYNETETIVQCVRSLLTLRYGNYEVIVVNDGSTDDCFDKACKEFDLEKMDYVINNQLETMPVIGVYRSRNKAFHNLVFVDKENGGKADALNAGINISTRMFTLCVDADSILPADALLKLIKPVTESTKKQVVAVGGAVHVANGCHFKKGVLVEKRIPKEYSVKLQVVEYLRSFLIGRMAWSHINGLMIVSGALGLFRKDYVIEAGGYKKNSLGEDMELIVRMRCYLYEKKIPHKVVYLPEPLLWTEVPQNQKTMGHQRTRWTRGLIDTLRLHKKLFFNPKYGTMGMISYPYFVFFEWLAPFVEALGFIYLLFLLALNMIQWKVYLILFLFMYLFGVCFSFFGLLFGEVTYHVYEKKSDMWKLFLISLTEIFFYHPFLVYWSIKGNLMYLIGRTGWGNMSRKGVGA